jgi:hypothetical protein
VVEDRGDGADAVAGGGFEHLPAQGLDQGPAGASQEGPLVRVPLELFAGRDAQAGGDAGQVVGERGEAVLGEDRRREGKQVPEPGAPRAGVLAVVQERHAHPELLFCRSKRGHLAMMEPGGLRL